MPTDFLSVLQGPTVDLFANYPMDFELPYRDSVELTLVPTTLRRASIAQLIEDAAALLRWPPQRETR
jgi:hypothetical protein